MEPGNEFDSQFSSLFTSTKSAEKSPRTALKRFFTPAETAAVDFWRRLYGAGGQVLSCKAGRLGLADEVPVVHRTFEGKIILVEGSFELEVFGEKWRAVLDLGFPKGNVLTITLEFPPSRMTEAEAILDIDLPTRIQIKTAIAARQLRHLYSALVGIDPKIKCLGLDKDMRGIAAPKFRLEGGHLVPEELAFEFQVDNSPVRLEVRGRYGEPDLIIDCDEVKREAMLELLSTLETDSGEKGEETHVVSVHREIDVSGFHWSRFGGGDELRRQMEEWVEAPLLNPELFRHLDLKPPKGIMLAGPPGNGKTLLAKILACETDAAFFYAAPSDIYSMWLGQSERAVAKLFAQARQALKRRGRSIIFFDELDSLFASRDKAQHEACHRIMAQLLTELDGLEELTGVTVLAATNRLEVIDAALMRPGRFDRVVSLGLPDEAARLAILRVHTSSKPLATEVELEPIAQLAAGFSGAELEQAAVRASFNAARRQASLLGVKMHELTAEAIAQIHMTQLDLEQGLEEVRLEKSHKASGTADES